MITIMVYEVNGKRFDDLIEAKKYEKLCEEVDDIMNQLLQRTDAVNKGYDFNKQVLDDVKACFKKFCEVCAKTIPSFEKLFIQVGNGERHISHIGRILSDYSYDYPILDKTLYRFGCISFENGYEFQQPYYVTHQEEFFKNMEKRLKYKNDGN